MYKNLTFIAFSSFDSVWSALGRKKLKMWLAVIDDIIKLL